MAMPVGSVPLSETQATGLPRSATIASSSRPTRSPESEVSGDQRQALPGEVVEDGKDAKPPAVAQLIMQEIQRPALVRVRQCQRRSRAQRSLAAAATADLKTFLGIQLAQLL